MRRDETDPQALRQRALTAAALSLGVWGIVILLMLLGSLGVPPAVVIPGIVVASFVGAHASSALRRARMAGSADGMVRLLAASAAVIGVGVTATMLVSAVVTALLTRDFVF